MNTTGVVYYLPLNWLVLFSSVEVNNFLKIDENQNEEVENELPESPVSGS